MNMGLMNFDDQMPPVADPIQPGIQAPEARPLPMPVVNSTARPSLMARIGHALMSAGGHVSDAIRPTAPGGYEGVLTPEEMQQARPSLLHSLIGGPNAASSDQQYANNLDSLVEHKQVSAQVQREKEILSARQAIMQRFPMPTSGSEADLAKWANQVMPWLTQAGDFKAVTALQPILGAFAKQHDKQFEPQLYRNKATSELRYFDPSSETQIPLGFERVEKPTGGSNGMGTAAVWSDGQGHFIGILPGDDEKMKKYAALGYQPDIDSRTDMVQTGIKNRFTSTNTRTLQNQYRTSVKPLTDMADTYNKAYQTIDRAAHSSNPTERKLLYGAVQSQFTQASDQAKNLRFQLLQYYTSHQSPDLGDTFDIFFDKFTKGELPPRQINAMLEHVKALANENARQIDARRSEFLNNNSGTLDGSQLPAVSSYFSYPGLYDPKFSVGPSAASPTGKYSPNNPFAGKK